MNAIWMPIDPGPAPLAMAAIFVLSYASVSFFWTYTAFLRD